VKRHLILVGLPGSGKTTVGRRAAELLPTDFTDTDEAVETETGRSISRIFAESGEEEFRRLERAAMDRALERPPQLIAAGAGWIAEPGNLEAAEGALAFIVYLRISPANAARRLEGENTRPLLAGVDAVSRLESLLVTREPWYRRAGSVLDASGTAEQVAKAVVGEARRRAGWDDRS